ncbi:MAG: alpha/beta hydrolase [Oscillospiraceae bacterium]|nr:alpha/beta hydrolase [Oscillospiraceae bacterium]
MSSFLFEGRSVFYEECGEGAPLLLLHGNTASGKMFDPIVPPLSARYRVMRMDFLGCGRSDRLRTWPADLWYDWARQVAAFCAYKGLDKIFVIGCSGGALAAVNAALEYPELIGAAVADSFEGTRADPALTEHIRAGRAQAKRSESFREYLRSIHGEDWEAVFDADTDAVLRHASETGAFFHKPLESLRVRLLLTGSREDEMFPAGHYERLFAEITGKTGLARARIFEHGRHPAMMSNREAFVSLCGRFFAGGEEP